MSYSPICTDRTPRPLPPDQVRDSLHAYQLSKRGNSLRVMAEAVRWGKRGARINTISPGIVITPQAKDERTGPENAWLDRSVFPTTPVHTARWGFSRRANSANS